MAANLDILDKKIVEGDDVVIVWTLTHSDGSLYDFTPVTKAWITLKADPDDLDANALVGPLNSTDNPTQVKYGDPDPGEGKFFAWFKNSETTALATHKYVYYDIQVLNAGKVNTLIKGRTKFEHEITVVAS